MYEDYYVKGKEPQDIPGFENTVLYKKYGFNKEQFDQYMSDKQSENEQPTDQKLVCEDGPVQLDDAILQRLHAYANLAEFPKKKKKDEGEEKVEEERRTGSRTVTMKEDHFFVNDPEMDIDVECDMQDSKLKEKKRKRVPQSAHSRPRKKKPRFN